MSKSHPTKLFPLNFEARMLLLWDLQSPNSGGGSTISCHSMPGRVSRSMLQSHPRGCSRPKFIILCAVTTSCSCAWPFTNRQRKNGKRSPSCWHSPTASAGKSPTSPHPIRTPRASLSRWTTKSPSLDLWIGRRSPCASRRCCFAHRTGHSARSADQRYASSSFRRHRTGPHGYLRQPRLRLLQLPILRKRPNHHRHASHHFPAARNSRRPRHRLQRLPPCRPVRPSPALHPRWTLTHGPATISDGLSVGASLPFPFTRICLDFWLPCVILPLGHIYVTVDVPVARSPEASFPQLTLTLFS